MRVATVAINGNDIDGNDDAPISGKCLKKGKQPTGTSSSQSKRTYILANPFDLSGKTAVITGAAGGIGAAISKTLAEAGAHVLVADVNKAGAEHLALEIGEAGQAVAVDVTDEASVDAMFTSAKAAFGGVDIFVASAGISDTGTIFETTLDEWNRVLAVNLTGNFLCTRAAARIMRKQGRGGRLIVIGSPTGHRGALRGHVAYASSKGGSFSLVKTLARTLSGDRITVNVVTPGQTDTALLWKTNPREAIAEIVKAVPLGLASVTDVAGGVLYLASDAACHITGTSLDIDGGGVMR